MPTLAHTKFFNVVDTFANDHGKLNAVMTRTPVNSHLQRNSKHRFLFFS